MDHVTLIGAFVAGAVTSCHCIGMCGPIVCGMSHLAKDDGEKLIVATLYHGARLFSYGVVGFICGALGQQPLRWIFDSPVVLLPWLMVIVLLCHALLGKVRMPMPLLFSRLMLRMRQSSRKMGPFLSASIAGLMTPLLPCTPLYLFFGALLLSSSGWRGMECSLAFGMGTLPLLWLLGTQYQYWVKKWQMNPKVWDYTKRSISFLTALIIAWRMHDTLPIFSEKPVANEKELPSCCH